LFHFGFEFFGSHWFRAGLNVQIIYFFSFARIVILIFVDNDQSCLFSGILFDSATAAGAALVVYEPILVLAVQAGLRIV